MLGLSVRQPWAWAIVHGGKDIENRRQLWSYRGLIAIHASRGEDRLARFDRRVRAEMRRAGVTREDIVYGRIIGVANLVDAHHDNGCCRPWGEPGAVHLVLKDTRPIDPLPCRGSLGLWRIAPALEARIQGAVR